MRRTIDVESVVSPCQTVCNNVVLLLPFLTRRQGVPVIGKVYPPEFLANPKNHRLRPSIYVETENTKLVVDTTPEFRLQMLREGIRWIDAIIFTHGHADQVMGLDDCRQILHEMLRQPFAHHINRSDHSGIYAESTAYAFNSSHIPNGYFQPDPRIIEDPFCIGDLLIVPLSLPHGKMRSNGYLFQHAGEAKLAYLSDCKEVPDDVVRQIRGVKVVVLDALRREPHWTHMCLDEALTASRRIQAGKTFLTHLTHDYDHDLDQEELPPSVAFAYDGLKINIP